MSSRIEQIRDLLAAELAERDIEQTDHVGEFVILIGMHSIDEDGHLGWVSTILSDDDLSSYVVLGLLDHKRMQMAANMTNALRAD